MIFHVKAPFRIELFQAGHAKTLVRIYVDKKMFGVFLLDISTLCLYQGFFV